MGRFNWLVLPLATVIACVADPAVPREPPAYSAAPWPAADRLFRGDPHWVGADGAYSVDLGGDRTLWLFADTFIDPTGKGSRSSPGVTMIGNSVAIQRGRDPSRATIEFAWWRQLDGRQSAFFADSGAERYWPGNGIRIGANLLVFLMRVRTVGEGLGFRVVDWDAVLVPNPDDPPAVWKIRRIETSDDGRGIIVGSAGLLLEGEWLYAYGSQEPGARTLHLARFPVAQARDGNLSGLEWWTRDRGFVADAAEVVPDAVITGAQSELTVHRDVRSGRLLMVQTVGFGGAEIGIRDSHAPAGPWFEPRIVYRPEECGRDRVLIYQGKAHPELVGADLVVTYCSNHLDFGTLVSDDSLYFPRFVRFTRIEP